MICEEDLIYSNKLGVIYIPLNILSYMLISWPSFHNIAQKIGTIVSSRCPGIKSIFFIQTLFINLQFESLILLSVASLHWCFLLSLQCFHDHTSVRFTIPLNMFLLP